MVDTVRNAPYLENLFRDGQPDGTIIPQDVRDFVVSVLSTSAGITAAGTNQSTATALSSFINVVTNVAPSTGVILTSGLRTIVMNRGANSLLIYPPVGGTLESLAANLPFSLQVGADAMILFDTNRPFAGYLTTIINIYAVPTAEPSSSGIVWSNGGVLQIS